MYLLINCFNPGLRSDSEENAHGKGELVNSGDEFDHFYD